MRQGAKPSLRSQKQENCSCPSLAAALRRADPAPCLGNTEDMTLSTEVWVNQLEKMSMGDLAPPLSAIWWWEQERDDPLPLSVADGSAGSEVRRTALPLTSFRSQYSGFYTCPDNTVELVLKLALKL